LRIVVTGALGHIGSRLIRELPLAFPAADIVLVDNLSTQRYCSLFDLPASGRYRFIEADVLTADLDALFAGADAVIHLAAITKADETFETAERVEAVNFHGTERVARACARAGAGLAFISTTSVYGGRREAIDDECPAGDLHPQTPYADSKLRAERLLESLGAQEGLRFVVCRFGTIFGVSPGMRFHTAVNKFCMQAATGRPITVWRSALHQFRPYLDLGDAVAALLLLIRRELFDRRVYSVVTLNATVSHVVEAIRAHVPGARTEFGDSAVMNLLSYKVESNRLAGLGFRFSGDLDCAVGETLRLFDAIVRRQQERREGNDARLDATLGAR